MFLAISNLLSVLDILVIWSFSCFLWNKMELMINFMPKVTNASSTISLKCTGQVKQEAIH